MSSIKLFFPLFLSDRPLRTGACQNMVGISTFATPASYFVRPKLMPGPDWTRIHACRGRFDVKSHVLSVIQMVKSGSHEREDLGKNFLRAMLRGDKAKAFFGVEPFHGAITIAISPDFNCHPHNVTARPSVVAGSTGAIRKQ